MDIMIEIENLNKGENVKIFEQPKGSGEKQREITEAELRKSLDGYYKDIRLAIETLNDGHQLQTDFAIYWYEDIDQ